MGTHNDRTLELVADPLDDVRFITRRRETLSELLGWRPQAKQLEFLRACGYGGGHFGAPVADIVGYGGAAGGGKSDALLALACGLALCVPGVRVGIFRRRLTDMTGAEGLVERSHKLLERVRGARFNSQKMIWRIGESTLHFCYCEDESDKYRYQGWQFDCLLFDEATHFTETQVAYLTSRARLTVEGLVKPVIGMASNPGNIGHAWFERIFRPMEASAVRRAMWAGATREFTTYFVPARLADNAILCERDPTYLERLRSLDEVLRLQLLDGRWDIYEGMAFPHHPQVVGSLPSEDAEYAVYQIGVDWGYAKPFCAILVARWIDGRYFVVDEVYEAGLTPFEQAQRVFELRRRAGRVRGVVADASVFSKLDGVTSVADQWIQAGLAVTPATRDRLGSLSLLRQLFKDGQVLVHRRCENLLREIRNAQVDTRTRTGEDITGDDHAIDALRYALAELANVTIQKPPALWSLEWVKEQARLARRLQYEDEMLWE